MGRDISPIGNHKLSTESIEVLAHDISSRIDVNIEYGYWGRKEHFRLLGENGNDGLVVLGKIIKDNKFKTFRLTDETFQGKQLYEKLGDHVLYNPEYWIYEDGGLPDEKYIKEERKELTIPNFEMVLISKDETEWVSIHKELYCNDIPYYTRWWSFCGFFTKFDVDFLPGLIEFRKELMKYTFSFGGDKIYYLDDQSDVLKGVGSGSENGLSWEEFENFVVEKTSPLLLDIPKFLTDRNYRDTFLEKNKDPLSFVDDFSDIK